MIHDFELGARITDDRVVFLTVRTHTERSAHQRRGAQPTLSLPARDELMASLYHEPATFDSSRPFPERAQAREEVKE